jgi:RNA polymerase sigma factor (sigma-70 family)
MRDQTAPAPGRDVPDETGSLEQVVRGVLRRLGRDESPQLFDDCLQEARVCLWQLGPRLETLAGPERGLYARACVRHAVAALLQREFRQRGPAVALEELIGDLPTRGQLAAGLTQSPITGADGWLDEVAHDVVSRLVARLTESDRQILDLYYAHGMTDGEVARSLGLSRSCVEQRRSRLLRRLRRAAQATEERAPARTETAGKKRETRCQVPVGSGT